MAGVDCYEVRKIPLKTWDLDQAGAAPQSPRSVYQKRGRDRRSMASEGGDKKDRKSSKGNMLTSLSVRSDQTCFL